MTYHAVTDEALTELGKIAVAGGLIERRSWEIAQAIGLKPSERATFAAVKKEAVSSLNQLGVPLWARAKPSDILHWYQAAQHRMDERNRLLHASFYFRGGLGEVKTYFDSPRDRRGSRLLEQEKLGKHSIDMAQVINQANQIWVALLPQMDPGVYVRYLPTDAPAIGVVTPVDGDWPTRPLSDDIDAFVKTISEVCRAGSAIEIPFTGPNPEGPETRALSALLLDAIHNTFQPRRKAPKTAQ